MSLSNSDTTTSNVPSSQLGKQNGEKQKAAIANTPFPSTQQHPRFCIVCCEKTAVTQQISAEIAKWNLPDVRSLLLPLDADQAPVNAYRHNLPSAQADAVAHSEYAIFITPSEQPCSQIRVHPLNKVCNRRQSSKPGTNGHPLSDHPLSNHPSLLLSALHYCHGRSPQAWWLQLPTTEVRAQYTQPIPSQKSVSQALHQIGIFMRNYRVIASPSFANNRVKSVATKEMAADKVAS